MRDSNATPEPMEDAPEPTETMQDTPELTEATETMMVLRACAEMTNR